MSILLNFTNCLKHYFEEYPQTAASFFPILQMSDWSKQLMATVSPGR